MYSHYNDLRVAIASQLETKNKPNANPGDEGRKEEFANWLRPVHNLIRDNGVKNGSVGNLLVTDLLLRNCRKSKRQSRAHVGTSYVRCGF